MEIRSVNPPPASAPVTGGADSRTPAPVETAGAQAVPSTVVQVETGHQAAQPAVQTDAETLQREIADSVKKVNDTVHLFNSSVQFTVDEDTKRQVVKVVDLETDKIIRQIPSEDILAIARAFDKLQGLLIKDKA